MHKKLIGICLATLLAACGGGSDGATEAGGADTSADGGGDPSPVKVDESAMGLWTGTSATQRSLTGVVLSDGSFYMLYTSPNTNTLGGLVQGSGTQSGSSFTSTNAVDFNFEGLGVNAATVQATATTQQAFDGSVRYGGGTTVAFTSRYDADFKLTPSLVTIAGTYTGETVSGAGTDLAVVTVTESGAFVGDVSDSDCDFSGNVTPRNDGNVYDVTVTFDTACDFPGQTLHGVAYYDAAEKRLFAAALNGPRTDAAMFTGLKP